MTAESVWIVDDDDSIRWVLERALDRANYRVLSFAAVSELREALSMQPAPQVIISDIRMPGESGLDFLKDIQQTAPDIPVIIITAHSDLDSTVSAYDRGAFEYLPKPFDIDEVISATGRACEWQRDRKREIPAPATATTDTGIIGEAPAMQDVFRAIGRLSRSNLTVLINGESGSGKELIARALHRHSPRASGPFIAINVAAIPTDLIESELFGHEKGAFTGAHSMRQGRFEQAHGGTLFLDEIGDMPVELQTRLLRVIADGQFYRVGGHTPVTSDVRIITATHRDLQSLVDRQQFREDLFHRLNVIRINSPPLRERDSDIPALLRHFLASTSRELGVEEKIPSAAVIAHLQTLAWPGNVRQLENLCRWVTVMAPGRHFDRHDLPDEFQSTPVISTDKDWQQGLRQYLQEMINRGESGLLEKTLPAFEKTLIDCAMETTGRKRQEAAQLIGWGRNTLTRKIKQLAR